MGLWTYQNLVEEVLDELLLQRPGSEQAVEIGPEQLRHKVAGGVSMANGLARMRVRTCPRGGR
jgi:hypothetical protein